MKFRLKKFVARLLRVFGGISRFQNTIFLYAVLIFLALNAQLVISKTMTNVLVMLKILGFAGIVSHGLTLVCFEVFAILNGRFWPSGITKSLLRFLRSIAYYFLVVLVYVLINPQ